MTADGASGAIIASIKFGVFAFFVSIISVAVGFTVIPLTPGKELLDAARRLSAGLLTAFIFGPVFAAYVIGRLPEYLSMWIKILGEGSEQVAYLVAAMPMMSLCSLIGFWLMAAIMRFFTKRQNKDILQFAKDFIYVAKCCRITKKENTNKD